MGDKLKENKLNSAPMVSTGMPPPPTKLDLAVTLTMFGSTAKYLTVLRAIILI